MRSLVSHRVYGKDTQPTLYYLTGYRTHISQYLIHIKLLNLIGFRVVAFEYDKAILSSGDPNTIINALDDIKQIIQEDKKRRIVAGLYCISLGSWLGLNLLTLCCIEKAIFLTGGVDILSTVWNMPAMANEKATYQQNGFKENNLHKIWRPYDYTPDGTRFADKRFILFSSKADEVLQFDVVKHNLAGWKEDNPNIEWLVYKRLNHTQVIIWGMFRIARTFSFFKI